MTIKGHQTYMNLTDAFFRQTFIYHPRGAGRNSDMLARQKILFDFFAPRPLSLSFFKTRLHTATGTLTLRFEFQTFHHANLNI
jgi:hypothetical protein